MSVTLTDLITAVNNEVGNIPERGNATATGDATTVDYLIAPPQRFVVDDDDTFAFYIDGVGNSTGVMNFDNGVYSLYGPEDGHTLYWEFDYVYWPEAMVEAAVYAGVNAIFPFYYKKVMETADAAKEITLTTPHADVVTTVETGTAPDYTRIQSRKWETFRDGDNLLLRFYSAPSGTLRVHVVQRPALIDSILNVPDRALDPIVSYAAYYLLTQKVAPRMRSDVAMATIGGGNLSPRQMNDASNSFYLRHQMQCQAGKMHPWSIR